MVATTTYSEKCDNCGKNYSEIDGDNERGGQQQ